MLDDGYSLPVEVEADVNDCGRCSTPYSMPSRLLSYKIPGPAPVKPGRRDCPLWRDCPEALLLVFDLDDILLPYSLDSSAW